MSMDLEAKIALIAQKLSKAYTVTVLTGAGVSSPSGIPTFRGTDGMWRNFQADDLATPDAFVRDPKLVWEWYDWRRQLVAAAKPNRAHEVLAAWSKIFLHCYVITQNVDGLHDRAGSPDVVNFHGSIWNVKCAENCGEGPKFWRDERVPMPELPPHCPYCDGLLRPAVIWFGEPIEPGPAERAFGSMICDVFFSIGTSSLVYPAAGLIHEARQNGGFTVEINIEPTPISDRADLAIHAPADEVLAAIEKVRATLPPPPQPQPSTKPPSMFRYH